MKRVLRAMARLYPRAWRTRYGAEFEALLEDRPARMRDAADVAWGGFKMRVTSRSFVWIVLPCSLAGGLVALALAWVRPTMYTSGTVVVSQARNINDPGRDPAEVEAPQIPDLVRKAFADQEAMARIIRKYNLYPGEQAKMPMQDLVERMRSAIRVRSTSRHALGDEIDRNEKRVVYDAESSERFYRARQSIRAAFTVQFEYPDPRVAQFVDAELVGLITRAALRDGAEPAASGQSRIPGMVTVLNAPNLPDMPDGLSRLQMGLVGLFGGLLCGIAMAMVSNALMSRRLEGA